MTTSLTLQLDSEQINQLEQEAARRGVSVNELVAQILAEHVPLSAPTAEEKKRRALEALEELDRLREAMRARGAPPIDAVALVREGREELERRTL
jgi:hypothetical protein